MYANSDCYVYTSQNTMSIYHFRVITERTAENQGAMESLSPG